MRLEGNFRKSIDSDLVRKHEADEILWSKEDLGKYTINTPTQEKQAAQNEDKNMQLISELEFQEISEDADKEDIEMQKKFEQMAEELEGIF